MRRLFLDIIPRQLVDLVDDQLPSAKVEVSYAEVYPLYSGVGDDVMKSVGELQVYVVEYPGPSYDPGVEGIYVEMPISSSSETFSLPNVNLKPAS